MSLINDVQQLIIKLSYQFIINFNKFLDNQIYSLFQSDILSVNNQQHYNINIILTIYLMNQQQWYSQYLFEIVLKKLHIKQKLRIINKVAVEVITNTHLIRSRYTPKVKNNVAFFYYEHIKIPFMEFLEIAVINVNSIRKREEELGRIKVDLTIFENEELVNCKFIDRISNTFQIYLHYNINIVRRDASSNPNHTQNQYQLSYLEEEFNGKSKGDASISRISEYPLKIFHHTSIENISRAMTELNRTPVNSPRDRQQQFEVQKFESSIVLNFIENIEQKDSNENMLQNYEEKLKKIYQYHKIEENIVYKQLKHKDQRKEIERLKQQRKNKKNKKLQVKISEGILLVFALLVGCFLRIL